MDAIYHITTKRLWDHAREAGQYRAGSLKAEGFIHASTADQLAATANRYYAGQADLVLMKLDPRRLRAPLKWERSPHSEQPFPHVYGPINLDAVLAAAPFEPGADGEFPAPT